MIWIKKISGKMIPLAAAVNGNGGAQSKARRKSIKLNFIVR